MISQKNGKIVKKEAPASAGLPETWNIPEGAPRVQFQSSSQHRDEMVGCEPSNRANVKDERSQHPLQQQANISSMAPYPSGDVCMPSSGAFIERCDGMEINGGKFNQIYGHHTSVTIHVNQPPEEEYVSIPQRPLTSDSQPFMSELSYSRTDDSLVSTSKRRAEFESFPNSKRRYLDRPCPDRKLRADKEWENDSSLLYNSSLSSMAEPVIRISSYQQSENQLHSRSVSEQRTSSSQAYAPQNSNNIYEQHLGLKGRGFPLWIPEPNKRLPMCYRREGVNIGDVGIITASGGFSFLFNICLPRGHPINPSILPDGFAPISPSIEPTDICEFSEFNPGSYLASNSIEKIQNGLHSQGLSFETSAAEGAILTLPEGAIAFDLENVPRFRAYAAANIESWYRYVNGPRGREAKNGEIRLVIGCDKATSWGMAAIANLTQSKKHNFNYLPVDVHSGDNQVSSATPIPLYKWEYTGLAEARVGPDLREIRELERNDDSGVAVDGKYWNQCLFLRTLNPTLSDEVFSMINQELEAAFDLDPSQQVQNIGDPSQLSNNSSSNTSSQLNNSSQASQSGTGFGTQRGLISDVSDSFTDDMVLDAISMKERVTMSRSITTIKSHPADVLNKTLLQIVPGSRVVITQDEDWCSVLYESDTIMPKPAEIAERVMTVCNIKEEDVFLEPIQKKESSPKFHFGHISSETSAKGRTHSQGYMSTSSGSKDSTSGPIIHHLDGSLNKGACVQCHEMGIHCMPPLPNSSNPSCYRCRKVGAQCVYPSLSTQEGDIGPCLPCRRRKIKCSPPPPGSTDRTCNQCYRRSCECVYPSIDAQEDNDSRRACHPGRPSQKITAYQSQADTRPTSKASENSGVPSKMRTL